MNNIEQFARNMCKERGKDFDTEFKNFMSNIKGISNPKQAVMKYMQGNNNPMVQMLVNQMK